MKEQVINGGMSLKTRHGKCLESKRAVIFKYSVNDLTTWIAELKKKYKLADIKSKVYKEFELEKTTKTFRRKNASARKGKVIMSELIRSSEKPCYGIANTCLNQRRIIIESTSGGSSKQEYKEILKNADRKTELIFVDVDIFEKIIVINELRLKTTAKDFWWIFYLYALETGCDIAREKYEEMEETSYFYKIQRGNISWIGCWKNLDVYRKIYRTGYTLTTETDEKKNRNKLIWKRL